MIRRLESWPKVFSTNRSRPLLIYWGLIFTGRLSDGDKNAIIDNITGLAGKLSPYFEVVYGESLRCLLL